MFISPKIEKKEICKSGIFILDDVLSDNQLGNLRVGLKVLGEDNRKNRYLRKWNDIKFAHPLLKIVSKYFNLKRRYRYELWQHILAKQLLWHTDKDEDMWEKLDIISRPLFGLVYYPLVGCSGGDLILENGIRITPKSNRLVLFSSGTIKHCVEEHDGYRHSFLINVWNKKKLGV